MCSVRATIDLWSRTPNARLWFRRSESQRILCNKFSHVTTHTHTLYARAHTLTHACVYVCEHTDGPKQCKLKDTHTHTFTSTSEYTNRPWCKHTRVRCARARGVFHSLRVRMFRMTTSSSIWGMAQTSRARARFGSLCLRRFAIESLAY